MVQSKGLSVLTIALAAIAFSGCGPGYDLAPVSGRITRNGEPVAELHITFQPVAEGTSSTVGPASVGRTDADGAYQLHCVEGDSAGAVPREHIVTIVHASSAFFTSSDEAPTPPPVPFEIPARFTNGSTRIDVPAEGLPSADFTLDSP